MNYLTEPLVKEHNRKAFSCGKPLLDNYFKKQANQDVKQKLSTCFVSCDNSTNLISGYYTLSSNEIPNNLIPQSFKKRLPKSYDVIPTTLLGRLAVDKKHQGKRLGKNLLIDSLKRCFNNSHYIGSFAVIVDPLDNEAENFYTKYGFIKLLDSGKMFLPMETIKTLFP